MRVYLLGFMGAGKTSVGASLARYLQMEFIDLDAFIEAHAQATVQNLFAEQGEAAFRKLEAECLRLTGQVEHAVVATGGGTPCHSGNLDWINQHGLSIYLKVPAGELARRLARAKAHRPLISQLPDQALADFIEKSLLERSHFYEKAQFSVEVNGAENALVMALADFLVRFLPVK